METETVANKGKTSPLFQMEEFSRRRTDPEKDIVLYRINRMVDRKQDGIRLLRDVKVVWGYERQSIYHCICFTMILRKHTEKAGYIYVMCPKHPGSTKIRIKP